MTKKEKVNMKTLRLFGSNFINASFTTLFYSTIFITLYYTILTLMKLSTEGFRDSQILIQFALLIIFSFTLIELSLKIKKYKKSLQAFIKNKRNKLSSLITKTKKMIFAKKKKKKVEKNNSTYNHSRESQKKVNTQSALSPYYKLLGVSPTQNKDELKRAYRGLMKKHHPDKVTCPHLKNLNTRLTIRINNAYQTIRNETGL